VRAIDSILDHAKQAIEIEDVEVRVAPREQAAEVSKSTGHRADVRTIERARPACFYSHRQPEAAEHNEGPAGDGAGIHLPESGRARQRQKE
jgi:hypothetical protein